MSKDKTTDADLAARLKAAEAMLEEQAAELEGARTIVAAHQKQQKEGKGDLDGAALYRLTVLTDLHKNRGVPATDHPALHDPDLSADEWPGTAEEKKALAPKVKKLLLHLKANPMVSKVIVVQPTGQRLS